MNNMIRVIIADDHEVVRAGLVGILAAHADIQVIGEAQNGVELLRLVAQTPPDLVLMDIRMPVLDGVETTVRLRQLPHPPHVLVLTTYDSDGDILRAMEAGAVGYLLKDTHRTELLRAIRMAARGETVLAPSVTQRLMGRFRTPHDDALTVREVEVLGLVAKGLSNQEVAKQLHIGTATVKTHLLHIFAKLNTNDRTAAVTIALERGILRLD